MLVSETKASAPAIKAIEFLRDVMAFLSLAPILARACWITEPVELRRPEVSGLAGFVQAGIHCGPCSRAPQPGDGPQLGCRGTHAPRLPAAPHRDDLRHDRDRDLVRRDGAEVEPCGRLELGQAFGGDAALGELRFQRL